MHSSTSSSSVNAGTSAAAAPARVFPSPGEVYERPIPAIKYGAVSLIAVIVALGSLGLWEYYWRSFGSVPSYRNSDAAWAAQRRRISTGEGNATVFIGSSRTMSNLQLHVWERLGGERPIQLAFEGTTPLPALESLADDPQFTGRLLVGVTPVLFFTGFERRAEAFRYYKNETPSQRMGQQLSVRFVEPYFAFYDPDFALFMILQRQPWPERAGVTLPVEPRKLFLGEVDRGTRMWSKLEQDAEFQELAKSIWMKMLLRPPDPEMMKQMPQILQAQIDRAAAAVEKLRARGVEVVFVLHPAEGPFLEFETKAFPRERTWDALLARTGAPGIHYQDYPELQGHEMPEWSHMSGAAADRYTEALYRILHAPQGPFARQ